MSRGNLQVLASSTFQQKPISKAGMVQDVSKLKSSKALETALKVVFLALLVIIVISSAFLLLLFFVPIVVWYIWSLYDKTTKLERRIAALEKPGSKSDA